MSVTFLTNEDKTLLEQSIIQLSEEIAAIGTRDEIVQSVIAALPDASEVMY